ncbi:hypothetical protein BJ878DRAFT_23011 [Calycina marina]|uniref:Peptidase M20 dimerisation domain-containing protein n=1 Tax=Calycina marina TaxID=1763456 RepID=A0A9P7Z4P9_9HELO|nr:hypothetical protein BJ878DRAFT_23011 [Calycina marina]
MALPQIDEQRLWVNIMETSKYGAHKSIHGGMSRLSLSDGDRLVRNWFVEKAKSLGCEVKVDEMGNIFATWYGLGSKFDASPIGMGSHLDTQPIGGRFDGVLGVIGALEVIETLQASGVQLGRPLTAINWTNEEGARFPAMCSGSSVWADNKVLDKFHNLQSFTEPGKTMRSELATIQYLGDTKCCHVTNKLAAHFELHIEQATVLEKTGKQIGVVTGIQGMRWFRIKIVGAEGHAGSSPMSTRVDAMVAAAKIILHVDETARRVNGFGTVGCLKPASIATNTIVGSVELISDFRHASDKTLDEVEAGLQTLLRELEIETPGLTTEMKVSWLNTAIDFHEDAIECVEQAAKSVCGESHLKMISRAAHDSAETAKVSPTAMIFVPSRNGISHNPEEYTTPKQCLKGVQVLLESVVAYDRLLTSREGN